MRLSALVVLLLFASSFAAGGEIYGTIHSNGRPIAAGVKVEIAATGNTFAGETNKFGAYRIFVKEKGKCTLKIHIAGQSASAELFSYDKSTRYDWILEINDGTPRLRRK